MRWIQSPNWDDRSAEAVVDTLVLHYTGMKSGDEARARMCDPTAKVSAHYMIYEDGETVQLVPENKRAWHAGVSHWRGKDSLNDSSIGIELVNPGHEFGYRPFPAVQMNALVELSQEIVSRHPIPPRNIVGHSDVAPLRKEDPGELFNWLRLAQEGVGLFPILPLELPEVMELDLGMMSAEVESLQARLAEYGYLLKMDGYFGNTTQATVKAFQRHFTPEQVNGAWGARQEVALNMLLKMV
jgi:N-acetylmuramoyl-L-alanine amidase